VVAAALRGYFPAQHPAPRSESGGRAALVFGVAILAATLALVAIAVVARLRDPRAPAPSAGALSDMLGTGRGRPSWRVLLIGLAVIVAWLLIVTLMARLLVPHGPAPAPSPSETGAPPSSRGATPPHQQQHRPRDGSQDMLGVLLAGTVAMLLMVVAGTVATARRRWRPAAPGIADEPVGSPAPGAPSRSLVRAAERGLAEMTDPRHEPREAIIACYAAMERELAHVPGAVPQDFDTPSEVLARAIAHQALPAGSATVLVDLFEEARFSPHVMNEGHRTDAMVALQTVQQELQAAI
jgi:hypothetical protein